MQISGISEKELQKKLRVGWFTFTCCEDSTIIMTEVMNEHWEEWKRFIDFRHARVLRTDNILDELDVAFVEGAISSDRQAARLKEIREKAKRLVAVGACAVIGMPSSQRNLFDESTKRAIQFLVDRFGQKELVRTVKELVKVDAELPGCPMNEQKFLEVLERYLKEFNIIKGS
ncbi:MAG: hypothetical protein WC659_04765 [Patescibacteria group bacterium]